MVERYKNFDSEGFFRALESTILARGKNWKQVSVETSVSASTLTRMAQGKSPDAPSLAALSSWAGINPADFVQGGRRRRKPEPLAEISRVLRGDPNLSNEGARALDEMIKATYRRLIDAPKK